MQLFLSYSHRDELVARPLMEALSRSGISMWLDTVDCEKGSLLPIEVSQALARCKAFCILVSRHSMESRWVQAELSAAFDRWTRDPGFRILPIVLD